MCVNTDRHGRQRGSPAGANLIEFTAGAGLWYPVSVMVRLFLLLASSDTRNLMGERGGNSPEMTRNLGERKRDKQ
jgi:hypothetical protein